MTVAIVDGTQPPYTVVSLPLGACPAVQFVLEGSMVTFVEEVAATTSTSTTR